MITRLFFGPRLRGMSTESCLEHWRARHAAIGSRLPGLRGYVQNHGVLAGDRFLLPYPGFDIMPELEWDDLAAMDSAIDSPIHETDSLEDERLFIDTPRAGLAVTERRVLLAGQEPSDGVKLITLFRAAPTSSPEQLVEALEGDYAELTAEAAPLLHELLVTVPDRPGRTPYSCQAVDLLWFSNATDALGFTNSVLAHRALSTVAGRAFGTERLIARPHRVL